MANSATITIGFDSSRAESDLLKRLKSLERSSTLNFGVNERSFTQPLGRITAGVDQFDDALAAANKRVIAFGASASIILGATQAFQSLVASTIEVESSLKEINVILNLSSKQLESYSKDLFNVSRETSQAFNTVTKAAVEFSRQGLSAEQTLVRVKDAMILTRLSGLDTEASVSALTAAVNGFAKAGLDTTTIVNKLANVDAAFAVSSKDLAEALSRVGSSAQDAGVSFDQLIGLVTAAQQTTARGGAVIGNSLKTIFTRIGRESTLNALEELGVQVRNLQGDALPALTVLQNLAKAYDNLGQAQRQQVAESVGGVFQINQLKAVLGDLNRDTSIYTQAQKVSANATDEATKRNKLLNTSLTSVIQNLSTSAKQASSIIGSVTVEPLIRTFASIGTSLSDSLSDSLGGNGEEAGSEFGQNVLRGIGNVISGPGVAYLLRVLTGVLVPTAKELFKDIRQTASKDLISGKENSVQKGINELLKQASVSERERFLAAKSTTQQQEILLSILERQLAVTASLNAQQTALRSAISTAPIQSGLATKIRSFGAGRSSIPNFADPLGAAIRREQQSGVSKNDIYIDTDPRLKSSTNPAGLLVANYKDEPRGGFEGVDRVLRSGKNPKFSGSGGFVPNFAEFDTAKFSLPERGGKYKDYTGKVYTLPTEELVSEASAKKLRSLFSSLRQEVGTDVQRFKELSNEIFDFSKSIGLTNESFSAVQAKVKNAYGSLQKRIQERALEEKTATDAALILAKNQEASSKIYAAKFAQGKKGLESEAIPEDTTNQDRAARQREIEKQKESEFLAAERQLKESQKILTDTQRAAYKNELQGFNAEQDAKIKTTQEVIANEEKQRKLYADQFANEERQIVSAIPVDTSSRDRATKQGEIQQQKEQIFKDQKILANKEADNLKKAQAAADKQDEEDFRNLKRGTFYRKFERPGFAENATGKKLENLGTSSVQSLINPKFGDLAGNTTRERASILARQNLFIKPTREISRDSLSALTDLSRKSTLEETFLNDVKKNLLNPRDSSKGNKSPFGTTKDLDDAIIAARRSFIQAGGVTTQFNEALLKNVNTLESFRTATFDANKSIARAAIFNKAQETLQSTGSFSSLDRKGKALITSQIRSQILQERFGGASYSQVSRNKDAKSQVDAELAKRIEGLNPTNGFIEKLSGNKTLDRFSKIAPFASFALPFASGFIPEGTGGTAKGQALGAASGGLQGLGFGATLGSAFGPIGTLIGAIGGAAGGGLIGAFNKSRESIEEFSSRVSVINADLSRQSNAIQQYAQTQELIGEALDRGDKEALSRLQKTQAQNLSVLSPSNRAQLINAGFNQDKIGAVRNASNDRLSKQNLAETLRSSFEGKLNGENIASLVVANSKNSLNTDNLSSLNKNRQEISSKGRAPNLGTTKNVSIEDLQIAKIDQQINAELVKLVESLDLSAEDKAANLAQLQLLFKKDQKVFSDFVNTLSSAKTNSQQSTDIKKILEGARISESAIKEAVEASRFARQLRAISFEGGERSRAQRFSTGLSINPLTEGRISSFKGSEDVSIAQRKGTFELAQAISSIRDTIATGKVGINEPIGQKLKSLPDEISSLEQGEAIIRKLEKDLLQKSPTGENAAISGDQGMALQKIVDDTKIQIEQNKVLIAIAKESAKLQDLQVKSAQKQAFLQRGTFNADSITQIIQNGISAKASGTSNINGINSLISQQDNLSSLGFVETNASLDLSQRLRGESSRATAKSILSQKTGLSVDSDEGIREALKTLNSGNEIDKVIADRIKETLDLSNIDFSRIQDKLLSGSANSNEIGSLVSSKKLGLGEAALNSGINNVATNTKDIVELTKRILFYAEKNNNQVLLAEKTQEKEGLLNRIVEAENNNQGDLSSKLQTQLASLEKEIKALKEKIAIPLKTSDQSANSPQQIGSSVIKQLSGFNLTDFISKGVSGVPKGVGSLLTGGKSVGQDIRASAEANRTNLLGGLAGKDADLKQKLANLRTTGTAEELSNAEAEYATFLLEKVRLEKGAKQLDPLGLQKIQVKAAADLVTRLEDSGAKEEDLSDARLKLTYATIEQARIENKLSDISVALEQAQEDYAELLRKRSRGGIVTGDQLESAKLKEASLKGLSGDTGGSFSDGFSARIAALKNDLNDLSQVGNNVARSIENGLGNAFGDFVTGAKNGKDAFRDFTIGILNDAARAFASKAVQGLLSMAFSSFTGFSSGGVVKRNLGGDIPAFASGGRVPALLTGGEYVFGPEAAKNLGSDTLRGLNTGAMAKFAAGGMVQGGSGIRDDVPARLRPGSFVIKKSAVQKYGSAYLNALAENKVQKRFWGGVIMGAVLGGGIGYATGGKKGAITGALLGGVAGGLAQNYSQSGNIFKSGTSGQGLFSFSPNSTPSVSSGAQNFSDLKFNKSYSDLTTSTPSTTASIASVAGKTGFSTRNLLLGLGASAALGLAARAMSPKAPGTDTIMDSAAISRERERQELYQYNNFTRFGVNNQSAFLNANAQGGQSLIGYGQVNTQRFSDGGAVESIPMASSSFTVDSSNANAQGGQSLIGYGQVNTQRFSDGGAVESIPMASSSFTVDSSNPSIPANSQSDQTSKGQSSSSNGNISISITINNQGEVSTENKSDDRSSDFGSKLGEAVRSKVLEVLAEESRSDGFFARQKRLK